MQQFLHKVSGLFHACAAGFLIGPFVFESAQSERWPMLMLSIASVLLIFMSLRKNTQTVATLCSILLLAAAMFVAGVSFEIDKLLLLSGAILFCGSLLKAKPISRTAALFATVCACLMVPLPANLETELASKLASIEASLFAIIGQAAGLPVRLSGTQVFFEQSVVTINQDCSGLLLILPTLMGTMVAAALAGSRKAALAALVFALPIALFVNLIRLSMVMLLIAQGHFSDADAWHDMLGIAALTVCWALPVLFFANLNLIMFDWLTLKRLAPEAATIVFLGVTLSLFSASKTPFVTAQMKLPSYVSGWVAEPVSIPNEELRILNAAQVARQKYSAQGKELIVTSMYHLNPKVGREHSSERCFRAMGWQVKMIGQPAENALGLLTHLIVKTGGHSQSVLELEIDNHLADMGLVRIQLVASLDTPVAEQNAFLEAFANKTIGESL